MSKKPTTQAKKQEGQKSNGEGKPVVGNKEKAPKTKLTNKKKKLPKREVIDDKLRTVLCVGEKALTAEKMKELLGWQTEKEGEDFGSEYLFLCSRGKKVICTNNLTNRPIDKGNLASLQQEHLRRRWKMNGEPIIIGDTGTVLNGQHQGISLINAVQMWEDAAEDSQLRQLWPTEPVMEKLVVFGVEETDLIVNTLDTAKSRSLADVLYRSSYFAHLTSANRKKAARTANFAVISLWERTGAGHVEAFAPRRTHAEALDFVESHPTIIKAVEHILEENGKDNAIGRYLSPGFASGLLYLMAAALTNRDNGETEEDYLRYPHERNINLELWDKACEFWVALANGDKKLEPVRVAIIDLHQSGQGNVACRRALLIKAWNVWSGNKRITAEDLELEFEEDENKNVTLAECPLVGGIDIGKVTKE